MCWCFIVELLFLLWICLWWFRLDNLLIEQEYILYLNSFGFGILVGMLFDFDEMLDFLGFGEENFLLGFCDFLERVFFFVVCIFDN